MLLNGIFTLVTLLRKPLQKSLFLPQLIVKLKMNKTIVIKTVSHKNAEN